MQRCGTHDFYTPLVFVKVGSAGVGALAILVEQHLRTVCPIDGLFVITPLNVSLTGVDGTHYGFLESAAGGICFPALAIVLACFLETLSGLFVLSQVELAYTDIVVEYGVVDIGADARFIHFVYSRYSYL